MDPILIAVVGGTGAVVVIVLGVMAMFARFYKKVDQGRALVISKTSGDPMVTFSGGLVLPVIHRAEEMDISVKTIEIDRRGTEGLICKDNIRADIKVTFFVRVNKTQEDVLQVAQSVGVRRASSHEEVETLFAAKFSEALKTVGKRMDFEDLYKERAKFRDDILSVIGDDLNGFVLDDAAIDYLEQTPIEHLSDTDVLDAQGIHKITMLTSQQHVLTNKYRQTERMEVTKQNVEADQAVFELEKQRAEAEARKEREIAVMQAKEAAETAKVRAEEQKRAEMAQLQTDEELAIAEENKQRQIAVAQWNKQRTVTVEAERVEKDKGMEIVAREREVDLARIAKDKALEAEKKEIADLVSSRISVEKKVAEEEEGIKTLRAIAGAERDKDVVRIGAEAAAQEKLVKDIKGAEAAEEVAKYQARTKLIEADADLEAADKEAKAEIRRADGSKATQAAPGLAEVQVKEAMAQAIEKEGLAKARVTVEQMGAEASGQEKKGLAGVKVREADAEAIAKQGEAEARATREKLLAEAAGTKEKLLAEASGEKEKGLAEALVGIEKAAAVEKQGLAEATATREKLLAEAAGLSEKAVAMQKLQGAAKEHEEFRIRLEKETEVELARIEANKHIAEAKAETLGEAFKNTKMNIVGGDGEFFDKFVKAVGVGQSVDGFVEQSETAQKVLAEYLKGESSLPQDLKDILVRPRVTPEHIQSLTLSAALGQLARRGGIDKNKLQQLIDKARELGFDPALGEE
ncbi:MAG: SPFH domain-containing protein [Sandaracinaceae bacterium]